jgi:hypothetical protein
MGRALNWRPNSLKIGAKWLGCLRKFYPGQGPNRAFQNAATDFDEKHLPNDERRTRFGIRATITANLQISL